MYTKLFSSITDSTIWQAPDATRLVWITMLAMADKEGYVGASIPGLANRARVSLDDCLAALDCLLAPDKWSRTEDFEGRRIECADGGWNLLNYTKYRTIRNEDDRREQSRVAMAKLRALRSKPVSNVNDVGRRLPTQMQSTGETPSTGTEQPETNTRHGSQGTGNKAKVTPTGRAKNPKLLADLAELDRSQHIA